MVSRGTEALSRWTGEFLDAGLERAFQADAWPRLSRHLRVLALIAGTVYLLALSLDWQELGEGAAFRIVAFMRLGTGLLFGAIAWASGPSGSQERVHRMLYATIACLVATRLAVNQLAPLPPVSVGSAVIPVFPLMPLIIFAFIAIPTRLAVLWSAVGSLLFLWDQAAVWGLGAPVTRVVTLNLLLGNGIGYAFRLAWNRMLRRDFMLLRELEHEVEERLGAEREALRANAAKGRFLAVMSHEIRTPLNGVLGSAQLLQTTPLLPEQRQPMEILARSGHQLAMLLDDVLDLARIEAGKLELLQESFSAVDLLDGVHAMLSSQALAKGLDLWLELPVPSPPPLLGDALRLRQILLNLAGNALKFTERGEVVISLDCAVAAEGRLPCTFAVRDTGPGLEAEALDRIFTPFEQGDAQTHHRHGGAGLGLAISRELVIAMGGELHAASRVGQGSRFSFELVLSVAASPEQDTAPLQAGQSLLVLVVDDLEANRIVAQGLLAGLGHHSQAAAGGAEALALVRSERFDAVLLDLHMPDMDGLEVFRRIRDLTMTDLPVFLVTADMERTRLQACLAEGMAGVLPKPVRKDRLAGLLAGLQPRREAEVPLLDLDHADQIRADLGTEPWASGVGACRASIEACVQELADTERRARALHRLAGVSGSYGLVRLHRRVRQVEALPGEPVPLEELSTLAAASLQRLEGHAAGSAAET